MSAALNPWTNLSQMAATAPLARPGVAALLPTSPAGYALRLAPGQPLRERARTRPGSAWAARWDRAAVITMLWHWGAEAVRGSEVRLTALEVFGSAELAASRHRDIVAELESVTLAHPFRERFSGQPMVALYRSDRQAEALDAHARTREQLANQLEEDWLI